jgi:transcriptional regulator with XRE-family HTH domain
MGMTQAEMAVLIHREPLAISRWERAEVPIDSNADALMRLHAIQVLDLKVGASVMEISGWTVPRAEDAQIRIDGTDPRHYQLAA